LRGEVTAKTTDYLLNFDRFNNPFRQTGVSLVALWSVHGIVYRRVREFKGQMEENEETDCFSRHRMQVGFRKYVYLLLP